MTALVTPLDTFPTGNQQNSFSFCDDEDYGSDGIDISHRHGEVSFEDASNRSRPSNNHVFALSFRASCEDRSAQRNECAPVLDVTSEEETSTATIAMAPRSDLKFKKRSSTEKKSEGISDTISTASNKSDNGSDTSDENEREKAEKKSITSSVTSEVSASARGTEAQPADVQIENCFVKTNNQKEDGASPSNDNNINNECKEEVKEEDSTPDVTSESSVEEDVSPYNDNNKECNEKVREEDSTPDVTSESAVSKNKRPNRRDRSQKSSKKRWKSLNAEDMGFHFSSFPRLPEMAAESTYDPTDECETTPESSVEISNGDSGLVETSTKSESRVEELPKADSTIGGNALSCEGQKSCHEVADDEELDDVAFFASLGVDVHDSGEAHKEEDIWQWDGIHFDNSSTLLSGSSKSHKDSTTSQKSTMDLKPWPSGNRHNRKSEKSETDSLRNVKKNNKYVSNMSKRDVGILFDSGCTSSTKTYLRPDRHRRQTKCHKAVKSKHAKISDVFHNPSKKQLYMHHRLIKMHDINGDFLRISVPRRSQPTPMPKVKIAQDWIKGIRIKTSGAGPSTGRQSTPMPPPPPPQNLNHVLAEANVPVEFELDLVSFLLSVQNRELTPEDYEMLLRLDDSVKAKTVSQNVLDSLKTETIGEGDVIDTMCTICMEPYVPGQVRKFLPCQHDFHNECIDTWLNNSSQNCPLDGLPVGDS